MKKFAIQHLKGVTSIQEIECEKVTLMEDRSIANLAPHEYKVRIIKPASLAGEVWCWWAVYDTVDLAMAQAELDLIDEAKRNERKGQEVFEPLKVLEKVKSIQTKML